jgi:hypothetical protein
MKELLKKLLRKADLKINVTVCGFTSHGAEPVNGYSDNSKYYAEQRLANERFAREKAESDRRFQEQKAANDRYYAEQNAANDRAAAEKRAQDEYHRQQNNSGGGNSGGAGSGGGSGGGGLGPDFHCTRDELEKRGYTETTVNVVTQSGILSAWATNALNEQANQTIQTYQSDDHAFRGTGNPGADNFVRFHEKTGEAGGRWHGSIQELESKAQLRFNASSHNSVAVAVQRFYDLPTPPSYSSQASFTPQIAQVEISRTVSGKEQLKVNDFVSGVRYSSERATGDLFSWLKFKP